MVKFFWERWHRATAMDMASKLQGKPTHHWIEADSWIDAYKQTLSKSKRDEFDKEWNKLEQQLLDFQEGKKGAVNPMMVR